MSTAAVNQGDALDPAHPEPTVMTAVITHRVRAGRTQGYEEWLKGISADASQFAGHIGVKVYRPHKCQTCDYVIVLQFDAAEHLQDWLRSETRRLWIDRVKPLIEEDERVQVLSGFEPWFQLQNQPSPAAPKRYKQAILVWVGVVSVLLTVSRLIEPLLNYLPWWPLRVAVNTAVVVGLLSYVIMPRLTKWFKSWLFSE
ncbi:MAG: antibiotic biosynthesis monooxygenase [Spirulinaceae cyanobacterium]